MKKYSILIALFLLTRISLVAQTSFKGQVVDAATKNPLAGATITVAGKNMASTDQNGTFSLPCSGPVTLSVSFIGYTAQKVKANCNDALKIELTASGNTLDNVEITATSAQNKSLLYQPVSITKLSNKELKRGQGIFLDDAIQTSVPGVQMNRRSVSGGQQFNIRGYGNGSRGTRGISSNFDGQGYKVYLNGIPVTDAEGITTLDDIDYGSVANVEIVKGPAGTLYGQAIAGAVLLKIVAPEKGRTSVGQNIMFGNYGLQRYTTTVQTSAERSSILLTYGKQKSDGFSIHNASHKDFVNFVGEFQPSERQSVTTYVGYTDSYDERLGELTLAQWAVNDYSGNPDYIKRNAHSHVSTFRAGAAHTFRFSKNISNTTSAFGVGFRSDASSAGGWTDKSTVNYGFRTSFDTKFTIGSGSTLSGITGMEVQRQDAQVVGYNMKADPNDPVPATYTYGVSPYWVVNANTSNTAFVTTPTSYFTEWTLALPKEFSITAGVGLSKQRIILDDRFNAATATRPAHFDTAYKGMVSPHFAINKVFNKKISAYASYSVGYKAPVSSYFFVVTPVAPIEAYVNHNLKPEVGEQIEIGTKGTILDDKLNYQLAFFHINFKDKMTAVAVPFNATTTAYSYMVNTGDQDHKGIEALIKYAIFKDGKGLFTNVTPFVNFTYADFNYGDNFVYKTGTNSSATNANNIDTLNYSNMDVFGVPKIMAAWGIDAATNFGLYANFSHLYKDPVNIALDRVTQNPESFVLRRASSYNLLNAKIGFKRSLSAHFDLDAFFGVNNITGTKYPIMIFVNQLPDAYIPAPPKAVIYGGINLKYNFK